MTTNATAAMAEPSGGEGGPLPPPPPPSQPVTPPPPSQPVTPPPPSQPVTQMVLYGPYLANRSQRASLRAVAGSV